MRMVTTVLTAMALVGVVVPSGHCQVRCPEGRTASGQCVDPDLATMNSVRVTAFTQPKFSYTAPPFLPNADRTHRAPLSFHEVNSLLDFPPNADPRINGLFFTPFDLLHPFPITIPIGHRP
jgi:hypothetical protein